MQTPGCVPICGAGIPTQNVSEGSFTGATTPRAVLNGLHVDTRFLVRTANPTYPGNSSVPQVRIGPTPAAHQAAFFPFEVAALRERIAMLVGRFGESLDRPTCERTSRREFLAASLAGSVCLAGPLNLAGSWNLAAAGPAASARRTDEHLLHQVGITTSSLAGHVASKPTAGKFTLQQLPAVLRDELGISVIDLNTSTIAGLNRRDLEQARAAADRAGAIFTNLKLNQRGPDLASDDETIARRAMDTYKRSIDDAAILGCRWVRVLPTVQRPDVARYAAALQSLASYCRQHEIELLIENYGWLEDDPASVPKLMQAVGGNVAACPDTGNWANNQTRYAGLKATFPLAASCDFKAAALGPEGEHAAYDLRRCFELGWQAGFRGPWCLEHGNRDRKALFRELALLRGLLNDWMKEAQRSS